MSLLTSASSSIKRFVASLSSLLDIYRLSLSIELKSLLRSLVFDRFYEETPTRLSNKLFILLSFFVSYHQMLTLLFESINVLENMTPLLIC